MDKHIEALIRDQYPEAKVLQQVPGVGPLISLSFILAIGDPHRFKQSRQVGPYLGLVPRQRESGERSPQLSISKAGNRYCGNSWSMGLSTSSASGVPTLTSGAGA